VRAERRIKAHTIAWNAAYGPQIYFAGEVMSAPGAVPRTCIDWRPLKHSTSPNVVLRTQANGYRCLLAVRDIEADETNVTYTTAYDAAAYNELARRKTLSTAGIISEVAS
jgi:hypothetical protein